MVILSAVLVACSLKWRNLANAFLILECVTRIVVIMCPTAMGEASEPITYIYLAITNTICLYVQEGSTIVIICVTLACQFFIAENLVYMEELTFSAALSKVCIIIVFVFCLSLCLMLLRYIKLLQASLRRQNETDKMLLDGMHEGVMILG